MNLESSFATFFCFDASSDLSAATGYFQTLFDYNQSLLKSSSDYTTGYFIGVLGVSFGGSVNLICLISFSEVLVSFNELSDTLESQESLTLVDSYD